MWSVPFAEKEREDWKIPSWPCITRRTAIHEVQCKSHLSVARFNIPRGRRWKTSRRKKGKPVAMHGDRRSWSLVLLCFIIEVGNKCSSFLISLKFYHNLGRRRRITAWNWIQLEYWTLTITWLTLSLILGRGEESCHVGIPTIWNTLEKKLSQSYKSLAKADQKGERPGLSLFTFLSFYWGCWNIWSEFEMSPRKTFPLTKKKRTRWAIRGQTHWSPWVPTTQLGLCKSENVSGRKYC